MFLFPSFEVPWSLKFLTTLPWRLSKYDSLVDSYGFSASQGLFYSSWPRASISLHIYLLILTVCQRVLGYSMPSGKGICTIASYGYGYVWNVHQFSIEIKHRNLEIRKTRNDFFVQVGNFLLPSSLKVFRHKEREAHSFYPGFFICTPPSRAAPTTRPRELAKANRLVRYLVSTLLSNFLQVPKIFRACPVRDVIRTV